MNLDFYLIFLLVALWLMAVIRTILGSVGLWQLKEYRLDRFVAHLRTSEGRRQLFNGSWAIRAGFAILLWSLGGIIEHLPLKEILISWYFFEGVLSYQMLRRNQLRRPQKTFRAILISFGALVVVSGVVWPLWPMATYQGLLLGHIITWLAVSLGVLLTGPIFFVLKQRLINRAATKRASLANLTVVGITGSFGKTSTKVFLASILKYAGIKAVSTPGNVNTAIGLAKFILSDLRAGHSVFIAEMGAYRVGEIRQSAQLAKPEIGILTAINDQHLVLFGSRESIVSAKYELIEALPAKGIAIINIDNDNCKRLADMTSHVEVLRYSYQIKSDVYATNLRQGERTLEFDVTYQGESVAIRAPLIGTHLVSSFLAAASAALRLGVSLTTIQEAALSLKAPRATMEVLRGLRDSIVIDDSYSANPDGVAAALRMLKEHPARKRYLVMRPMIELGQYAKQAHFALGEQLARTCDFAFFSNHDYEAEIRSGALAVGFSDRQLMFSSNVLKIADILNDFVTSDDVILIENRIPESLKRHILNERML